MDINSEENDLLDDDDVSWLNELESKLNAMSNNEFIKYLDSLKSKKTMHSFVIESDEVDKVITMLKLIDNTITIDIKDIENSTQKLIIVTKTTT